MEEEGIIEGYSANLSRKALGYAIEVFVEVTLSGQSEALLDQFEKAAAECHDIIECHLMAGEADYLLRVAASTPEGYENLHRKVLTSLPGVARLKSNFVLKSVKAYSGYPIKVG
jgi:DNA-binding Lrp family transcriptional regulator